LPSRNGLANSSGVGSLPRADTLTATGGVGHANSFQLRPITIRAANGHPRRCGANGLLIPFNSNSPTGLTGFTDDACPAIGTGRNA
jgi:hypothetical protein